MLKSSEMSARPTDHPLLDINEEVADALNEGRPVVALESTIIAHGMPFPQNVATAKEVEDIIRAGSAVPATIAVLGGRITVGLSDAQLGHIASAKDVKKLSRRDLPVVMAQGNDGATTVAATMLCAHLAGISVFATGGIGGVHRHGESTFDISADLEELAQTPVMVVSAGAKSILDLPKTLEMLETKGVPVIGYGTDRFPAFYARNSGIRVPLRLDDPETVALSFKRQRELGLPTGMLVANPIPASDALPEAEIDAIIAHALDAAEGIEGREVTPFLLKHIVEATGGRSLEANIALVKNNAALSAAIAHSLSTAF